MLIFQAINTNLRLLRQKEASLQADGSFLGRTTEEKLRSSGMMGPVLLRSATGAVGLQERVLSSLTGDNIDPGKNLEAWAQSILEYSYEETVAVHTVVIGFPELINEQFRLQQHFQPMV